MFTQLLCHVSPADHLSLCPNKCFETVFQTIQCVSAINITTLCSITSEMETHRVYHLSLSGAVCPCSARRSSEPKFSPRVKVIRQQWTRWSLNLASAPAVSQVFGCVWLHHLVLIAASSKNWQDFQQSCSFLYSGVKTHKPPRRSQ